MTYDNTSSGAIVITGSAVGALLGGIPGAIVGAILGSAIQEAIKCPKCGNFMGWNSGLGRYICNVCGYNK